MDKLNFDKETFTQELKELLNINPDYSVELIHGENPHQNAVLYKIAGNHETTINYELLSGEQLNYNNVIDICTALKITAEFYDVPCCTIVKRGTPSGVALGKDLSDAYLKALDCDPIGAYSAVVAFSHYVDDNIAMLIKDSFLDVIVAKNFTPKALAILNGSKKFKIVKINTPFEALNNLISQEIKITPLGILVQETNKKALDKDTFKVVTKAKPTSEMIEDAVFAWKIVKHINSNAVVVAKDLKTTGICGGQTSKIDAIEIALNRACDLSKDAILAVDAPLRGADPLNSAAQGRIKLLIQPGADNNQDIIIEKANKFNMIMITTGFGQIKN